MESQAELRVRSVAAAAFGNALEWYDFIVYGFLASIIARQFFPSEDEHASLLMALATFGVGFFMRPVGGILLGMYSDRKGRKAAMQRSYSLPTAPSRRVRRRSHCRRSPAIPIPYSGVPTR